MVNNRKEERIREEAIQLGQLFEEAMNAKVEDVAPNFRRKNIISDEQLEKIIKLIGINLEISPTRVIVGMNLLFLQGAASAGAPLTMSVDLGENKYIEKRNIIDACNSVTGHKFIRRIAETLAPRIGEFAYKNKLIGELGYRINNKVRSEGDEPLSEKELAYCSSFSQAIPDLDKIVSSRLSSLLAEDYQRRFENKKKQKPKDESQKGKKNNNNIAKRK